MHEVDYKIVGDDMQFVEVELDPQAREISTPTTRRGEMVARLSVSGESHCQSIFLIAILFKCFIENTTEQRLTFFRRNLFSNILR